MRTWYIQAEFESDHDIAKARNRIDTAGWADVLAVRSPGPLDPPIGPLAAERFGSTMVLDARVPAMDPSHAIDRAIQVLEALEMIRPNRSFSAVAVVQVMDPGMTLEQLVTASEARAKV